MITYENTCDPARMRELAKEALRLRLFVRTWHLERVLKTLIGEDTFGDWVEGTSIAVAYGTMGYDFDKRGFPREMVAVACRGKSNFYIVFVRPAFRRQGIGRTLIERLKEPCDRPPTAGTGADWSPKFWRSCGIEKVSPRAYRPMQGWKWSDGHLVRGDGYFAALGDDKRWRVFSRKGSPRLDARGGMRSWKTVRAAAKALDREVPFKKTTL